MYHNGSFHNSYCTCNRCPCCGKLVRVSYPYTSTITSGSGGTGISLLSQIQGATQAVTNCRSDVEGVAVLGGAHD